MLAILQRMNTDKSLLGMSQLCKFQYIWQSSGTSLKAKWKAIVHEGDPDKHGFILSKNELK